MYLLKYIKNKFKEFSRSFSEHSKFKFNMHIILSAAKLKKYDKYLIVDCGFNQGKVAAKMLKFLPDFSLIGFEVQQDIQHYSNDLKSQFPARDISVIYSAASTFDGEINYYEPRFWGKNYKGGTTTMEVKSELNDNYLESKSAPALDFAKWLNNTIQSNTFVFVKMDIEGAEYDVIEHLMNTSAINHINIFAIEWHAHKFPEPQQFKYFKTENKLKEYSLSNNIQVLDWF